MKKGTIIIIVIALVAAVIFWGVGTYNKLVLADEGVKTAWSQVENNYQRRADLIPNLVATVKGYAAHEEETLTSVVEARSKATQVTVSDLSEDQIKNFQKTQGELSAALGKLLAVAEAYPDLKANQNFLELQAQLEGTENRIAESRRQFNESAKAYNSSVRSFPVNIIAGMFDFQTKGYFEAQEGAEVAPKVEF